MTGARIKRAMKHVDDDTFMVTYGDGLSDVDVQALLEFHRSHGRLATVTTVSPVSRYGVLDLDDAGTVSGFDEKPQIDGWVNVGFFVFDRRVDEYLESDDDCVLEQGPLTRLAREGELMAYRHDGFFYAMDTYRELKILNELWDRGESPWKVWC
jgi:glucose-1-phosphate cytidylyltransferase